LAVVGWIDRIDEDRIAGWVHSHENPSRSERVDVLINGLRVLQVLAHKERPDLKQKQIQFTRKGFEITLADFTDRAANTIEFVHTESGTRIGSEQYTVFSTRPQRWAEASSTDLEVLRAATAFERTFYANPHSGSWNHSPDFGPIVRALFDVRSDLATIPLALLQVFPPSNSLARALAESGRLQRLGIVEPVEALRHWHTDDVKGSMVPEFYETIESATRPWDVIFLPMLHERSGPNFSDILKKVSSLLSKQGVVLFDIRQNPTVNTGYLLPYGGGILRVATPEEVEAEMQMVGLKSTTKLEFEYVPGLAESARVIITAEKADRRR
jgi:hypothetical protein